MKYLLFILSFLVVSFANAQADSSAVKPTVKGVTDYPTGVYLTLEDFIAKKVSAMPKLERRQLYKDLRLHRDSIVDQLFFYNVPAFTKYSDAFAISENGQLYIRQKDILKNARKGDRHESSHNPRSYHRVIIEGKMLYLEGIFANEFAKGAAYGIGGAGGGIWAASMDKLKGVVFDFGTKTFDIFKDCDNFKEFLKEQHINEAVFCTQFDVRQTRRIIEKHIK